MMITIDTHELGLTDLQAHLIAQSCDKRGALRRELAVSHERDLSGEARQELHEGVSNAQTYPIPLPFASLR